MPPDGKTEKIPLFLSLPGILLLSFLLSCGGGSGGGEGSPPPAVRLSWEAPFSPEDGAPMPGVAGYYVYSGTSPRQYSNVTDVGNVRTYTLNLIPGTYYFTVTAYDGSGEETEFSDEVTKAVR